MKPELNWAPDLPHMEVRRFIAERLRQEPPAPDLDASVGRLLGLEPGRAWRCTKNLDVAISLIPEGWWWHISHIEANIIPTTPVEGAPVSNSALYDFYGKPIGYSAMCVNRKELPAAVCEALLKAHYDLPTAFVVEASASEHNDMVSRMQASRMQRQARVARHAEEETMTQQQIVEAVLRHCMPTLVSAQARGADRYETTRERVEYAAAEILALNQKRRAGER